MSSLEPINVYMHLGGAPNPFKVLIILEELGVPYKKTEVSNPKGEEFVAINPNGRLPAIFDPNTGLTLWESGAIVEYLVETYDKESKLKYQDTLDNWRLKQFLHFQMSGQGPYYGQAIWFYKADEDIPLAKNRYVEQIVRVIEVLDNILKGRETLVGDKITYADLSFVPWNIVVGAYPPLKEAMWEKFDVAKKYPNYIAWHERMAARPSVKAAYGN